MVRVDMEFLFECLTRVEHEKRNPINTIALSWEENPTSLMN